MKVTLLYDYIKLTLAYIFQVYWWIVLIVFVVIVLLMFFLVYFGAKFTPSSNPDLKKNRKISKPFTKPESRNRVS